MIQYSAIVNIVTLVIFFVYLCVAIHLAFRHGLGHSVPWACIIALSAFRLTQVSIDLAATTLYKPYKLADSPLETGVAILTELGLTPLFMATSSLLNATTRPKGRRMQWILILLHVPLFVSLILIVAGGIDPNATDPHTFAATALTKAGVGLYCICFVILVWATAVITSRLYLASAIEVTILTTVTLSLPFFLVDVVYMMCFAFESLAGDTQKFNVISGYVTLQLCMQYIMEYIIVGLYLALGLELPTKAQQFADRAAEMDADEMAERFLWKVFEYGSSKQ
jgi:hypothetical protein